MPGFCVYRLCNYATYNTVKTRYKKGNYTVALFEV